MEKEIIAINRQTYRVVDRHIINYAPKPGEVFAELQVVKPHRGQIVYAVDQVFVRVKDEEPTGLTFLDDAVKRQVREYSYKLRPDRELNQGDVERKIQEKSPCCNRTMREIGSGLRPRRFCRKCDREVL